MAQHADFYSTLAQVIPVAIFLIAFEWRLTDVPVVGRMALTAVYLLLCAEVLCFIALYKHQFTNTVLTTVVGLLLPVAIFIGGKLWNDQWRAVRADATFLDDRSRASRLARAGLQLATWVLAPIYVALAFLHG